MGLGPAVKPAIVIPQIVVTRVVIKDDVMAVHYSLEEEKKTWTTDVQFKLDPTADPKTIDFTPTEDGNSNKGKWYKGLYEVADGKLRICYRGPDSTRPKSFADKTEKNQSTVYIYLVPTPKKDK